MVECSFLFLRLSIVQNSTIHLIYDWSSQTQTKLQDFMKLVLDWCLKSSKHIFKLRLGALIPRSVGPSVGPSVGRSSKNYKKITKLYKTLQNIKRP